MYGGGNYDGGGDKGVSVGEEGGEAKNKKPQEGKKERKVSSPPIPDQRRAAVFSAKNLT